jgi:DNA polymerase elongation subunit (family B)
LTLLPARLFRGMVFQDLVRMQVDIETLTTPGYDFPNADREGDAVVLIAMRDSTGWECCLGGPGTDEKQLLQEFVRAVVERDPDVIEGHNIFGFDLPYIATRAKRHRVSLKLGRDGSRVQARSSRFTAGERQSSYTRYEIYGRHVVDTLHMVMLYDVVQRELDSYGLKAVAIHFGVAAQDRTYVPGGEIGRLYAEDPERLKRYAMDDVRETAAISRILSPSYFYQTQLVPFSYQSCVTRGNATRIDALLVAGYLQARQALPVPNEARRFRGGLTDSLESGVFRDVWHADVRSLYPSIIVSNRLCPKGDARGLYLSFLQELREFRLKAKDAARRAETDAERENCQALQSTFKVLINSFYGYLGFARGTFNDFDVAEKVTAWGREILTSMLDFLQERGARVIEIDTDGLYFQPPPGIESTAEMQEAIQSVLPEGIDVEIDARYEAMFAYKSKNYALLDEHGTVSITGAALKSRGLERFQRDYIRELVTLLLHGDMDKLPELYAQTAAAIESRELPVADLAKRETLSTSPGVYAEKLAQGKTRRSAAYELVLKADREYKQGDQVAFYVTGDRKNVTVTDAARLLADADPDARDENVEYYLDKLAKLHEKLTGDPPTQPRLGL